MGKPILNMSIADFAETILGIDKTAAETAHKDTNEAVPAVASTIVPENTDQTALGKEQQAEAEDAGSTVVKSEDPPMADPRSDKQPGDPESLSADEPIDGSGQLGTVKVRTDGEKIARQAVLVGKFAVFCEKEAAQKEAANQLGELEKAAAAHGEQSRMAYLVGAQKFAADAADLQAGCEKALGKEAADKLAKESGGYDAMLRKMAMDDPSIILPELAAGAVEGEGAPVEGVPMEDGVGELPLEGGGEPSPEEIAAALAELGLTPEEVEAAAAAVEADPGAVTEGVADAEALSDMGATDEEVVKVARLLTATQAGKEAGDVDPRIQFFAPSGSGS